MEQKKRKIPSSTGILAAAVLIFLTTVMVLNIWTFLAPVKGFVQGETDFPQFVQEMQSACTGNTTEKTTFVSVNGLFSRMLGQRLCNNVIRLNNGMLTLPSYSVNITPLANNLDEFSQFLADWGIPFLYVQAPCKMDLELELLPSGVEHYGNSNADQLLELLEQSGVYTYDLRPALSATPELVAENFFCTDHHWTPGAALKALPMIVEQMAQLVPDQTIDMTYTNPDQWEAHTYQNWFLGSQGKRVGVFYGGVDDITYYTPKFDTEMSCAVPMNHYWFYQGDFSDAVLRMSNIETRDLFNLSPYCVYIGGDYPLVQHRNADAPNKLKVLLIKDSFTLPMQAYFSTLFQEVHVLDPRHLTSCSVSEYAAVFQPDVVVMMMNADLLGSSGYTKFGSDAAAAWEIALAEPETILEQDTVELPLSSSNYNHIVLADLEYAKRYTLRFDSVDQLEGFTPSVTVLLYDTTTKSSINYGIIDLEYDAEHGGLSWTFFTPKQGSDQLQLLLYAGMPGETAGHQLRYSGVTLTAEG